MQYKTQWPSCTLTYIKNAKNFKEPYLYYYVPPNKISSWNKLFFVGRDCEWKFFTQFANYVKLITYFW